MNIIHLCNFQMDLVGCAYAVHVCYFYLRRNPQVLLEEESRWVAGIRNLLLDQVRRLRRPLARLLTTFGTPRRQPCVHVASGGGSARGCSNCSGQSLCCLRSRCKMIFYSLAKECPLTSESSSCRFSSLSPAEFYTSNAFVCSSVLKWLRRIIPVR